MTEITLTRALTLSHINLMRHRSTLHIEHNVLLYKFVLGMSKNEIIYESSFKRISL